ncbi:Proton-coupled folate transporter [Bagarius yarrelli]|uniref:Proton-coupled folate transporter n=1 Tax=Bagarius yarrelli TaxID=175774 RepID=A0A556U7I6_BAGYA|nr:Proton-coupled folate transporter [Bagarius yarrelli]
MTSTYILLPASQHLVMDKVCLELHKDTSICSESGKRENEEVESRSSYILLLYAAITSLVSIPPAMMLGSWSDKAGRRSVMLLPFILSLLSGGVLLAMVLVPSLSVYWCLLAAAFIGLPGGHVSIFLSCFSFLADITMESSSSRTLRMAIAESMIFVGGMVGFLLGGYLTQNIGLIAAYGAYIACHVLAILYILLWLQDSKPLNSNLGIISTKNEVQESGAMILKYASLSFRAVFKRRSCQDRLKLNLLIICTFLNNLVAIGDNSVLLLYLMYEPREFTTAMFGVFNSARMFLLGAGLLGLFPLLMRCFKEMSLAKISVVFRAASYALLAFSTTTWMVYLVAVLGMPGGITQAVIRSLSSAIVGPDEQGAMFSFSASVEATCIVIAAIIFNGLYPLTLSTVPGMPFIIMATFCIIVLILMHSTSSTTICVRFRKVVKLQFPKVVALTASC